MNLSMPTSRAAALLSDPTLRARIVRVVRQRVPDDEAAQDIVQEACTEAYAYEHRLPEKDSEARKYLFGIVRNKIRMHIREWLTRTHESFDEEIHGKADPAPFAARHLLRKIVADVPARRWPALVWFVRVNLGESLADIAREEGVAYDAAHKRYGRMRAELRRSAHRLTTMAAVFMLGFGALYGGLVEEATRDLRPAPTYVVVHEPTAQEQAAAELRRAAFAACDANRATECLQHLDEARRLDPAGDAAWDVQTARKAAEERLRETPDPSALDVH